jgi:hypothetical protein
VNNPLILFLVVAIAIILVAGYFVLPKYIMPIKRETTFTDYTYSWVRQENPNLTSFTGNGTDGNWTTWEPLSDESNGTYYFCNYNVRVGMAGAVWEVKDAYGRTNYTIPPDALTESIIKVQGFYNSTGSGTITYQLYYGTAWHTLIGRAPITANEFYEDAIWWKFPA